MFFRDRNNASSDDTVLPMLPMRDVVVFPNAPMSLIVGRPRSVSAVEAARLGPSREIFLVTQKSSDQVNPSVEDLYDVGTVAVVEEVLNLPNGSTKILVQGRRRARIQDVMQSDPHFLAQVEPMVATREHDAELSGLVRSVKATFERFVKLNRAVPPEMLLSVNALEDPDRLADLLVPPLQFKTPDRQQLLALVEPADRLDRIYKALLAEIEFLQVEKKLKTRVKRERESSQREFWLNEQMKAIQKELGDKDGRSELEELASALAEKDLPEAVRNRAEKELRKLTQMNLMSAEATVVRNYLDWILALPWLEEAESSPELSEAAERLDEDHYGLAKVKERILEHLAVCTLVEKMRGPILCLVGPPGVGKTSLARSIARSTNRPFVKVSLGGLRDEAEIRGHRRTYIGAMPGKLLQAMKRAGQVDPVVLLDEIDKMSSDFRGDPSAAMLEVLDPEQNEQFNDHYLDLDYDLSKVMYVCTANSLQGIPLPLQDRLEIIQLSGYTEVEKVRIANRYLLPRQRTLNGVTEGQLTVTDGALLTMIQRYTKESGVRKLEQEVARVCRKVARKVVEEGEHVAVAITNTSLQTLLGVPTYDVRRREDTDLVGTVQGLAVSPWGGELLNIEVAALKGTGKLLLTGRLGDWLKESANAGLTYVRTRAAALHLDESFHEHTDLHIHYPGNAIKTDGPSAGIAMATAVVSSLTQIPVRSDTAMTGEISLRGKVLPIGGLKEKVLAAHRAGVTRVLLPVANEKDIEDIPEAIRNDVELITVDHMDRVLREALEPAAAVAIFSQNEEATGRVAESSDKEIAESSKSP